MKGQDAILRPLRHRPGGRVRTLVSAALAGVCLLLGSAAQHAKAAEDDRLVIAIEMDFNSLDPARTSASPARSS